MATIQRYVNTASTGGDGTTNNTSGSTAAYASLSACISALGVGNVADDYIIDCCGTAADTTAVSIPNTFLHASLIVRAHPTDPAGKYNGNAVISTSHYRLSVSGATPLIVACASSSAGVTIDGLQIITASNTATYSGMDVNSVRNACVVKNCRLHSTNGTNDYGIGTSSTLIGGSNGQSHTYENNLIVNYDTGGIRIGGSDFWTYTINIRHNTIYNAAAGNGIVLRGASSSANCDITFNVYANAIGNTSTNPGITATNLSSGGAGGTNYADNACSVASSTTDEIVLGTASDAWTSPGTSTSSDFSIKNTGSLYNAVNPTRVTLDIAGYTRDGTNHDVGAFEYASGPPTVKKLKLLAHSSAASASSVAGVVFSAPTGGAITGTTRYGEFTGKTFEASLESGQAVLKVPVTDFGGAALTTSDTPVALVRNSTNTTGIVSCTVIEE